MTAPVDGSPAEECEVWSYELGQRSEIKVIVNVITGAARVDLRIWVEQPYGLATVRNPTQKGVSIPLDAVTPLINALHRIATLLEDHGVDGQ